MCEKKSYKPASNTQHRLFSRVHHGHETTVLRVNRSSEELSKNWVWTTKSLSTMGTKTKSAYYVCFVFCRLAAIQLFFSPPPPPLSHTHAHTQNVYACTHTCMCTHTYMNICMHAYMHTPTLLYVKLNLLVSLPSPFLVICCLTLTMPVTPPPPPPPHIC